MPKGKGYKSKARPAQKLTPVRRDVSKPGTFVPKRRRKKGTTRGSGTR